MLIGLGEIINDAREYKEITRAELADYAGVSEELIEEIEENRTVPDFDTALLICHYLNIDVDVRWLRLITKDSSYMSSTASISRIPEVLY
jgi:transcriptional regulator with XRE-family HTH domain